MREALSEERANFSTTRICLAALRAAEPSPDAIRKEFAYMSRSAIGLLHIKESITGDLHPQIIN